MKIDIEDIFFVEGQIIFVASFLSSINDLYILSHVYIVPNLRRKDKCLP